MPLSASLVAAFIPILFYLFLLWNIDKYEYEEIKTIAKYFLWGASGAVIIAVIASKLLSVLFQYISSSPNLNLLINSTVIAPFVEELSKGAILFYFIKKKDFSNLTDGLILGGAVGLGFGMTENFLYFISFGHTFSSWLAIVFVRTFYSAIMHCISTGLLGAFLGFAKFYANKKKIYTFEGLFIAVFIHSLWNYSLGFSFVFMFSSLLIIIFIILFVSMLSYSLNQESEIIGTELLDEIDNNIISKDFYKIITAKKFRKKLSIHNTADKEYVKDLIELAFLKRSAKLKTRNNEEYFNSKIDKLREDIFNILRIQ